MDGNFKAEHLTDRNANDQVWLMDGNGFMVGRKEYKRYLAGTPTPLEVGYISCDCGKYLWYALSQRSSCNNHRAVNQANTSRGNLEATGIGATACVRHGCFVPHSVVDFQKGER